MKDILANCSNLMALGPSDIEAGVTTPTVPGDSTSGPRSGSDATARMMRRLALEVYREYQRRCGRFPLLFLLLMRLLSGEAIVAR